MPQKFRWNAAIPSMPSDSVNAPVRSTVRVRARLSACCEPHTIAISPQASTGA